MLHVSLFRKIPWGVQAISNGSEPGWSRPLTPKKKKNGIEKNQA